MSVVLARVDQRLIHGIVVTQWAGFLKAKRLMVIDDVISKDEAQKAAMRMSKPAGTGMSIIDTATAIKNFHEGKYNNHNVFLIVKEPSTILTLIKNDIKIPKVNIGIMFDGPDKKEVHKMVAVNKQEIADFKAIEKLGVPVTFRYVPSDTDQSLNMYIK